MSKIIIEKVIKDTKRDYNPEYDLVMGNPRVLYTEYRLCRAIESLYELVTEQENTIAELTSRIQELEKLAFAKEKK